MASLLGVADVATFGRMDATERVVALAATTAAWELDGKRRQDLANRLAIRIAELLAKAFR